MRLLITGSSEHWAIEKIYNKYLSVFFSACEIFDSAGMLERYMKNSYVNKIFFRTGLSSILKKINEDLLAYTYTFQPDAILVFKGVEILPETLKILRQKKVKLFNYNPDHPFIRTFRSGGGKNIEQCVPLYDCHFCYSRNLMDIIKAKFGIDSAWLPFGFEMDDALFGRIKQESEITRVCFAGNPDKNRAAFLLQMDRAGIPVDVYGHNWGQHLGKGNTIQINDAVYADNFWKTLRRYRVQLNLFRPHNVGSHNMRSFEVPAAGGIMLAPDTLEHRFFFTPGKEIFTYQSIEDCISLTKRILGAANEEIAEMRHLSRKRSVKDDYSYERRAHDVYTKINNICR